MPAVAAGEEKEEEEDEAPRLANRARWGAGMCGRMRAAVCPSRAYGMERGGTKRASSRDGRGMVWNECGGARSRAPRTCRLAAEACCEIAPSAQARGMLVVVPGRGGRADESANVWAAARAVVGVRDRCGVAMIVAVCTAETNAKPER